MSAARSRLPKVGGGSSTTRSAPAAQADRRSRRDSALIFGTLKALPAQLPEMVAAHWIENGAAGQMKEAA